MIFAAPADWKDSAWSPRYVYMFAETFLLLLSLSLWIIAEPGNGNGGFQGRSDLVH